MQLNLSEIRTDGGTQPRAQLDGVTVMEYAEAMERGDEFPPVKVMHDGEDYWLYDGFHRVKAARKNDWLKIEVDVKQGTKEDAQWASLAANKRHGLRRSQADKRRAIKRALKGWGTDKSNREIARHVGCSHTTVGRLRDDMETTGGINQSQKRAGADGRTIDTSNIGGDGSDKTQTTSASSGKQSTTTPEPDPMTNGPPSRHRSTDRSGSEIELTRSADSGEEKPRPSEDIASQIVRKIAAIRDEKGIQMLRDFAGEQHKFNDADRKKVKSAAQSLIDDLTTAKERIQ